MKRREARIGLVALFAAATFFVSPAWAALTSIDFDDVASGTLINAHYPGVTFSCIDGTTVPDMCSPTKDVFAELAATPESPPNVISLTGGAPGTGVFTDERFGYYRADFAELQRFVSIDALAVSPPEALGAPQGGPFLQAFGVGGVFLGQDLYSAHNPIANCDDVDPATPCDYETLAINRLAADIRFVVFSAFFDPSDGHPMYGEFDNLRFGTEAGPDGEVPLPASLLLLTSGAAGLIGLRMMRSRRAQS